MLTKLLKVLVLIVALVVLGIGGFLGWVQLDGIPKYAPGRIELKVEVTPERIARTGTRGASWMRMNGW